MLLVLLRGGLICAFRTLSSNAIILASILSNLLSLPSRRSAHKDTSARTLLMATLIFSSTRSMSCFFATAVIILAIRISISAIVMGLSLMA